MKINSCVKGVISAKPTVVLHCWVSEKIPQVVNTQNDKLVEWHQVKAESSKAVQPNEDALSFSHRGKNLETFSRVLKTKKKTKKTRYVQFTLASSRNNTGETIWEESIDSSRWWKWKPTYRQVWISVGIEDWFPFTAVNDLLSKVRGIRCWYPGRPDDGQWKEPKMWSERNNWMRLNGTETKQLYMQIFW